MLALSLGRGQPPRRGQPPGNASLSIRQTVSRPQLPRRRDRRINPRRIRVPPRYRQIELIGVSRLSPRSTGRARPGAPPDPDHRDDLFLKALTARNETTAGRVAKGCQNALGYRVGEESSVLGASNLLISRAGRPSVSGVISKGRWFVIKTSAWTRTDACLTSVAEVSVNTRSSPSVKKTAVRSMPRRMTCLGRSVATRRACRGTPIYFFPEGIHGAVIAGNHGLSPDFFPLSCSTTSRPAISKVSGTNRPIMGTAVTARRANGTTDDDSLTMTRDAALAALGRLEYLLEAAATRGSFNPTKRRAASSMRSDCVFPAKQLIHCRQQACTPPTLLYIIFNC